MASTFTNSIDYTERRKRYKCGSNFKTLDQIPQWCKNEGSNNLGSRISLWQGDITQLEIDAIANAANARLKGGGGVDGCIHRAAGPELLEACFQLGGCPSGSAKITPGFNLPAKYVIHCVGPIGQNENALRSTYKTALELCTQHRLKSVAFPCISTGIYGYPNRAAAEVAIPTVLSYLRNHNDLERVIFCVFLKEDHDIYQELLKRELN